MQAEFDIILHLINYDHWPMIAEGILPTEKAHAVSHPPCRRRLMRAFIPRDFKHCSEATASPFVFSIVRGVQPSIGVRTLRLISPAETRRDVTRLLSRRSNSHLHPGTHCSACLRTTASGKARFDSYSDALITNASLSPCLPCRQQ